MSGRSTAVGAIALVSSLTVMAMLVRYQQPPPMLPTRLGPGALAGIEHAVANAINKSGLYSQARPLSAGKQTPKGPDQVQESHLDRMLADIHRRIDVVSA
eukprot:gene9495-8495_t